VNCCNQNCAQWRFCLLRQQKPLELLPDPLDRLKPTPAQTQRADGHPPPKQAIPHAQHRRRGMALPIVRIALLLYAVLALWVYFFWL